MLTVGTLHLEQISGQNDMCLFSWESLMRRLSVSCHVIHQSLSHSHPFFTTGFVFPLIFGTTSFSNKFSYLHKSWSVSVAENQAVLTSQIDMPVYLKL